MFLCFQIGNWSRWLSDLFGIDDNDPPEDVNEVCDDKGIGRDTSFKPFQLLNALSDLMMLPCEMLADNYTRKEVKFLTVLGDIFINDSIFGCANLMVSFLFPQ